MSIKFSGVSSGSATANSGIFWTRTWDSGSTEVLGAATDLTLEVSEKADFSVIAFTKTTSTAAGSDYTTKVDLSGLSSGTSYYYRFKTKDGTSTSDVGQFKTVPAATSTATVRFGHSGDVDGLMAPYLSTQDLKKQKLDFFIFNGDTIYETASTGSAATLATKSVGTDAAKAATLLADYRRKYLETHEGVNNGSFENLDTFFASQGLYISLDNHELGNKDIINGGAPLALSTAGLKGSENSSYDVNLTGTYIHDSLAFKTLEQAYLEYQPIRTAIIDAPTDPRSNGTIQLYGSQQWGKNVVEINLDTRTYRDVRLLQADKSTDETGIRADNPDRTMLGSTQLAWLKKTLLDAQTSGTIWKFINITDPIDQIGAVGSGLDGGKSWMGGYRAERNNLLKYIADNGITNVVFLASDDHQGRINEVSYVPDPTQPTVYKKVPGVISIVDGPIGATGPDTVTDHTYANIKTLADTLATAQTTSGVDPIGLDPNYVGLFNVWREGDTTATNAPKAVDFYSPDTYNYAVLEVTPEGVLNVALRGVNSYAQNAFPTPSESNQPRDILRFSLDGLQSQRAAAGGTDPLMLKPTAGSGLSAKPIFTYGTNPEVALSGIPDGEGAFRIDNNTIRILVNSEIGKDVGALYTLDNGTRLNGARINFVDINNAGQVKNSGVAYSKVVDRFGVTVTDPTQISGDAAGSLNGFTRFCSANLFDANTFGTGKGFANRIFLMGEESSAVQNNKGGSMCALDVDNGVLYQLADLGYGSWEGATLVDTGNTSKVAIFLGDDSTPSFPMLYVGTKSTSVGASFLEKNGLVGGKMYVWVANDTTAHDRPNEVAGTGTSVAGSWQELTIYDATKAGTTGYDKLGYLDITGIHNAALAKNALAMARIEDEDYNHATGKGNQVVFNATGQTSNAAYTDTYGTTYTIDTTFTAGVPGAATLKTIYDGDDATNQQNGIRSQDNLAWSGDGYVYLNEDRAISDNTAWGTQEGSVWKLDPSTGKATRVAQIDRSAIPAGMTDTLAKGNGAESAAGQWETSGVIDVSSLYGHKAGTDFFTDVQAHGLKDGAISTNNLVEGGQLVGLNTINGLKAPAELKSVASTGNDALSITPLFTYGDSVGAFTPVGTPDGEGAFLKDTNTIRVLVNAEIGKDAGYSYLLANGTELSGARIQYFDIDKTSNTVKSAGLAYSKVVDRFGVTVTDPTQISGDAAGSLNGFTRFCSANLFDANTFGTGKGFANRIFLMGEESSAVQNNKGGSMCALDVDNGVLYQLADLGYGSWEGATLVDTGNTSKVAIFLGDDSTPSFPMLYVGTKSTSVGASFLEKNGLVGGKMYVWVANDTTAHDRPNEVAGTGTSVAGSWQELTIYDATKAGTTGYDKLGYLDITGIHNAALAKNALALARIEDEDYNHATGKGNQVVFNATGQTSNASYLDTYGTTYTIDTTFTAGVPGAATLKTIYDGDDTANKQNGIRSQDNLAWSADGNVYLNEDRAISDNTAWGTQEGSVWKLDPTTGSATRFAQIDRTALPIDPLTGVAIPDTLASGSGSQSASGQWETSGVIDVSSLYGHVAGTDFFTVVQAHGLAAGPIASNNLVEGGQILKLSRTLPANTSSSKDASNNTTAVTFEHTGNKQVLRAQGNASLTNTTLTDINQQKKQLVDQTGVVLNSTQLDFTLNLEKQKDKNNADFYATSANAYVDLSLVGSDLNISKGKALAYYVGDATNGYKSFTYDPTKKEGARFFDTNGDGIADYAALRFVDGGYGDKDGIKNGSILDPGAAAAADSITASLSASGQSVLVKDATNADAKVAVNLKATLSTRATTANEIGYIVLNDGEAVTFSTLTDRAQVLFSNLQNGDVPDLSRFSFQRQFSLVNGQSLRFFETSNSTLSALAAGKTSIDGLGSGFQWLSSTVAGGLASFSSSSGINFKLELSGDALGLSQLLAQEQANAPLLDFTGMGGKTLSGSYIIAREASYNSSMSFYRVLDVLGTVKDTTTGLSYVPGDTSYAAVAKANTVSSLSNLAVANLQLGSGTITVNETSYLAPMAVVNGSDTFFAYAAANSDGLAHFRSLGDNIIGLEDMRGGGDRDFDDLIIQIAPTTLA